MMYPIMCKFIHDKFETRKMLFSIVLSHLVCCENDRWMGMSLFVNFVVVGRL